MSKKKIIPFIYFGFLIIQMYLVFKEQFTPWKGGGFGMFSTINERDVTFELITEDTILHLRRAPFLQKQKRAVKKLPIQENFDILFQSMDYDTLYHVPFSDEFHKSPPLYQDTFLLLKMKQVNVLHWYLDYNNEANTVVRKLNGKNSYVY